MSKEINKENYIDHLLKNVKEVEKVSIIKEAYKNALDNRKFEIELYWKRATYFWAFIAVIFIATYNLINNVEQIDFSDLEVTAKFIFKTYLLLLISLLGYIFSLAWYFVNRGSKVWQKNWEVHINQLEDYINGPLYKTVVKPNLEFWNINSYYPFSVSKVNQVLSFVVTIFWFILINSMIVYYFKLYTSFCSFLTGVVLSSFVLFGVGYLLHRYTVSFMYKGLKKNANYDYTFKKGKNIVDIRVQQKNLIFWINMKKGTLEDPKNIVVDCSNKGHYGNGDYELSISDTNNLEYIMSLIKQAIT